MSKFMDLKTWSTGKWAYFALWIVTGVLLVISIIFFATKAQLISSMGQMPAGDLIAAFSLLCVLFLIGSVVTTVVVTAIDKKNKAKKAVK